MGRAYLVGAGPGDPGLLTLRAVECLREADFILYDYLTNPRTLDFARPDAERFRVTQFPGTHAERWQHIPREIIEEVRRGKVVVHLKGGDPLVFGRGAEEAEALRQAGVPFEIVPGVTAALAAAACAEIPLTHRDCASAVALVTGHEDPDKATASLDWSALARFPGTLAIYMGVTQLGHIVRGLVAGGTDSVTPAALVHKASTGEQKTIVGTLATLEEQVRLAGVGRPSLVLVGPAVGMKPAVAWFDARPLAGLRVLVTRPRAQAIDFVRQLELLGAAPLLLPVMDVRTPADWGETDTAIRRLRDGGYDWVVFTSANGVAAILDRITALGLDVRVFGRAQIAAIGPATAAALGAARLVPDLLPTEEMNSERLGELLTARCRDLRVLLPRAVQGRQLLYDLLGAVATVDAIPVYEQVVGIDGTEEAFDRLRRGDVDVVTLTSPNIATAFLAKCDDAVQRHFRDGTTRLVVNSDRLVRMLEGEGFAPVVTPDPTANGM